MNDSHRSTASVMRRQIRCPECGSARVVPARSRGVTDAIDEIFGSFRAQCRDCTAEFRVGGGGFTSMFYARCPRCMRQDLGAWDERHYHSTAWMSLRLMLGARRWRCEVCRCNFVSFRPRRSKYVPPQVAGATDA